MIWRRLGAFCGLALLLLTAHPAARASDALLADLAEKGNRAGARSMLERLGRHADVDGTQVDGMTALYWVVHHDDVETVTGHYPLRDGGF